MSRRFHHPFLLLIAVALLAVFLPSPTARVQAQSRSGSPVISARGDQAFLADVAVPCREYCFGWAVGGSADGYGVILRTDDGGVTWKRQGQVGEIPDAYLSGVSAVDARNAWVVGGNVILHTRNGGLTWKQQELPHGLPQDFELSQVEALDRHTALAVGSPSVLLQTSRRARPGDSGRWVKMPTGPHLPPIGFQDVDAVDARHVWAVGGVISGTEPRGGLAIAFYNGRRWRRQLITHTEQATCSRMIGLSALGRHTAWAVGGEGCPPYRTVNGGAAWRAIGEPVATGTYDTNRIVAVTHDLIWIAADVGIFRTINGGAMWQETGSCSGVSFCFAISAAGTKYAWASSLGSPPGDLYRWVRNHWKPQTIPATSSIVSISFAGARR